MSAQNKLQLKESVAQALDQYFRSHNIEGAPDLAQIMTLVEIPPKPELGDYAFPCFQLSKVLKKAPPMISQEVAKNIPAPELFKEVKSVGPYVNFFADYSKLAPRLIDGVVTGQTFSVNSPNSLARTMIEFSQPNTHKAFHVGHCRNVALGDALVRMNRYLGYDVVAANYIGDDGTHIAKCLWYFEKNKNKLWDQTKFPTLKDLRNHIVAEGKDPGEWLGELYTKATQAIEDADDTTKPVLQKEVSAVQQKLEAKEPDVTALWKETKEWSMESFYGIYNWLDVKFDHFFYESEVLDESRKIVADGLQQGVFIKSEGAIGIDLNPDNLGFFMLLKSDGTTLYSTRDLALARRKFEDWKVQRSLYVVASEQELHFRQVFKTLEKLGFKQVKDCFHLSYGLVVLPEGKMSSRVGNVILFSSLKQQLIKAIKEEAFQQIDTSDWSKEEIEATARKVAIAAIKYGMIASDPKKTIVFDMKKWLAFQGDTGPYLLYSYVRMKSILRKAGYQSKAGESLKGEVFEGIDERSMLKRIIGFNDAVARGVRDHSPAPLAGFLFDFCQEFNTFYSKTPILKQESLQVRNSYLALIAALSETLKKGCELLGIEVPERM